MDIEVPCIQESDTELLIQTNPKMSNAPPKIAGKSGIFSSFLIYLIIVSFYSLAESY